MPGTLKQRILLRTEVALIILMILIDIAHPAIMLVFVVADMIRLSYYPDMPAMMQLIGFNVATIAAIVRLIHIKRNKTSIIVLNVILIGAALTTTGWLWDNWGQFKYTTAEMIVNITYISTPVLMAIFSTLNTQAAIKRQEYKINDA